MGGKIQFSKKALEKNNNNSNNYVLSSVKSRWTWLLLSTITLFFATMVFWGFYGSMAESVSGVGITMLSYGSRPIVATVSGTLSHLNIQNGAIVRPDQIVGQIYNAESFFNMQKLESEYDILKAQIAQLTKGIEDVTNKHIASSAKKKDLLDYLASKNEESKTRAMEITEMYHKLQEVGATSKVTYYQSLEQRLQAESSLISTILQNISNDSENENILWDKMQQLLNLQQQLDAKEQDLKLARKNRFNRLRQ